MSMNSTRTCRPRHAFTLVELLVVIGVIAVLIGILLPSLTSARRYAERLKCTSNLRQLTMACLMHAQERGGYLPLAGKINARIVGTSLDRERVAKALGDAQRRRYTYVYWSDLNAFVPVPWHASIARFLVPNQTIDLTDPDLVEASINNARGIWKHFMCPSTQSFDMGTVVSGGVLYPAIQGTVLEVLNNGASMYAWSTNGDYVLNEGAVGWDIRAGTRRLRGNFGKLKNAGQVIVMTDGQRGSTPAASYFADPWQTWSPTFTSSTNSVETSRALPLGEALNATPELGGSTSTARRVEAPDRFDLKRHKGKINIGFADGHVETRTIKRADLMDVYILPAP